MVDLFIANEELLREYYTLCGEQFPDHKASWDILARQEAGHADVFRQIRQSIEELPSAWTIGKFFPQTLRLMADDLRKRISELRAGKLHPRYALSFIVDMESSLIETEIGKAFQTDLKEFRLLLEKVQSETVNHKNVLRSLS